MPKSEIFELHLKRSDKDNDIFSPEYQNELNEFSKGAHASSQRSFAMDCAAGSGGLIGEFVFNNAEALIAALAYVASTWITAKNGRRVRIKTKEIEIEASSTEEINEILDKIKNLQENTQTPTNKQQPKRTIDPSIQSSSPKNPKITRQQKNQTQR